MPPIGEFRCSACAFALPIGRLLYVVNAAGERVKAPHPLEFAILQNVFGRQPAPEETRTRTGWLAFCVCPGCRATFEVDLDREGKNCPVCPQSALLEGEELEGKRCPICAQGTVSRQVTAYT